MKQDLFNKIEVVKNLINQETESMTQLPEFLAEAVGSKKKATIESLKKAQVKLENELNKILALEEKEKREAPIRELMAKMNENAKIQKELKAQLDRAKALAKHDPKDTKSSIEQFKLANQLGEKDRELANLVEEKNKLAESK